MQIEQIVRGRELREVKWLRLRPLLESKKRGEIISTAEVLERTGDEHGCWRGRVIRFMRARGMEIEWRANENGWRVLTDSEQIDRSSHHGRVSRRAKARELRAAGTTDPQRLSETERRVRDHTVTHAQRQLADMEVSARETRRILGAPDAQPRLKAVKT